MYYSNKIEEIVFKITPNSIENAMLEGASLIKKGYHIDKIEARNTTYSGYTVQEPFIEINFKLGSECK